MGFSVDASSVVEWIVSESTAFGAQSDSASVRTSTTLSTGGTNFFADEIWYDERSLASGSNDLLDLLGLNQTRLGGNRTVQFAQVKVLFVVNLNSGSGDDLEVGPAGAANAWTSPFGGISSAKVVVGPQAYLNMCNPSTGWNVSTGNQILVINNSGPNTISYRIVLIGVSL